MRRLWLPSLVALAMVSVLAGCSADAITDEPVVTAPSATPTPTGAGWPAGADAETPDCQDASAATLATVNAAIAAVSAETGAGETSLPWLSARPDEELGVWTLTGLVLLPPAVTTEGGYFVVWATRDDPTSATFAGEVLSLGGSAQQLTLLPPLLPGYVDTTGFGADTPPGALGCGTDRARQD